MIRWIALFFLLVSTVTVRADGQPLRVVSLAPHLTEILFEIGAGEQIVGTVNYSDYPPAALEIPQVGGYNRLDLEAIVALRPDLIVAWESGNAPAEIERLQKLGLRLVVTEPRRLEDVAAVMEQLGKILGRERIAGERADRYRQRLRKIQSEYRGRKVVTVFYQVWNRPLLTINGEQIISHIIELCGGVNVFAELDTLSPQISVESVLERDPEVIIASGMDASRPEWLDEWRKYPSLRAVVSNALFHVEPDILQRHGPRLLSGAEAVCRTLQNVRN